MVEPWGKGELVSCLGHTLLDGLCTVGAPREEAAAQLVYRRGLDKDAHGTGTIMLLDIAAAFDIDIEENVFATLRLRVYLTFERTIKTVLIHFLVFEKLAVGNLLFEVFGRKEEVFHTIALCSARRT